MIVQEANSPGNRGRLRVAKSDVSDSDCPVIYTPQFLSLGEEPLRFPIYREIAEHVHRVARDLVSQD